MLFFHIPILTNALFCGNIGSTATTGSSSAPLLFREFRICCDRDMSSCAKSPLSLNSETSSKFSRIPALKVSHKTYGISAHYFVRIQVVPRSGVLLWDTEFIFLKINSQPFLGRMENTNNEKRTCKAVCSLGNRGQTV